MRPPDRTRTCNLSGRSRPLFQLSYQGIYRREGRTGPLACHGDKAIESCLPRRPDFSLSVRARGLEPPRGFRPTWPSTMRVYQFRHARFGWLEAESNRWPPAFQAGALPTELPSRDECGRGESNSQEPSGSPGLESGAYTDSATPAWCAPRESNPHRPKPAEV